MSAWYSKLTTDETLEDSSRNIKTPVIDMFGFRCFGTNLALHMRSPPTGSLDLEMSVLKIARNTKIATGVAQVIDT